MTRSVRTRVSMRRNIPRGLAAFPSRTSRAATQVLYRDLVGRIAGYCAYFVNLSPVQQAEINARTEERI
jgi:hypothetical protein